MLYILITLLLALHSPFCDLDVYGLRYFLENQFVSEVGLVRAATWAFPDNVTIFLTSDNLLAYTALGVLGSPLWFNVLEGLISYGVYGDGLHEVLLGFNIPDNFREPIVFVIDSVHSVRFNSWLTIKVEQRYGSLIRNWYEYADLIVYRALDSLLEGDLHYAERLFLKLMSMWDGYGFRDRAFNDIYETYKLALAIYLYRALDAANSSIIRGYDSVIRRCYKIISSLQRGDGGIVTHYDVVDGVMVPSGDANSETTSIVILAIFSHYPEVIGKSARVYERSISRYLLFVPAFLVLSLMLLCLRKYLTH